MKASDKIQILLKISHKKMSDRIEDIWLDINKIKPKDNRARRLDEIRSDADTYFIAEMDANLKGETDMNMGDVLILVDELFEELGINDVPPRRFKPIPSKKEKFTEL